MKITLTSFIIFISLAASAEDLKWYQGSVVLSDKSVLCGELAIHAAHDLILFRSSEGVMVYPAHKLSAFYYFDASDNINHKFVSICDDPFRNRFGLYETVRHGELLVVRKLVDPRADLADHAHSYNYFVVLENELVPFNQFKAKIFSHLTRQLPSFAGKVKERRLDPNLRKDIILIIALYEKEFTAYNVTTSVL